MIASVVAEPAQAAGLFEFLFGREQPRPVEPRYRAYAPLPPALVPDWTARPAPREPGMTRLSRTAREGAARIVHVQSGGAAYCVRTCDGYYFPLGAKAQNGRSDADMCAFVCPGARLEVFRSSGAEMSEAVGATGRLYKDLPQAFAYRKASIPACGCQKPASYAEWAAKLLADPTLRSGDLVVNEQSAAIFTGSVRRDGPIRTSELRDIGKSLGTSDRGVRQADRILGLSFRRELARASGFEPATAREPIAIVVAPTRGAAVVKSAAGPAASAAARTVLASPFVR